MKSRYLYRRLEGCNSRTDQKKVEWSIVYIIQKGSKKYNKAEESKRKKAAYKYTRNREHSGAVKAKRSRWHMNTHKIMSRRKQKEADDI